MIRLYFHPSPNPMKVALLLEEAGIPSQVNEAVCMAWEPIGPDAFQGVPHLPPFLQRPA